MANYYEETNISPRRFVPVTSRYAEQTVVYYTEKKLLTYNTYKKKNYQPNQKDKFMVVTKRYEYRPDLISYDMYGTPDFWWKIMEANGISDVFNFKTGLNIRLPGSVFV
jgi:hypothetical protein